MNITTFMQEHNANSVLPILVLHSSSLVRACISAANVFHTNGATVPKLLYLVRFWDYRSKGFILCCKDLSVISSFMYFGFSLFFLYLFIQNFEIWFHSKVITFLKFAILIGSLIKNSETVPDYIKIKNVDWKFGKIWRSCDFYANFSLKFCWTLLKIIKIGGILCDSCISSPILKIS